MRVSVSTKFSQTNDKMYNIFFAVQRFRFKINVGKNIEERLNNNTNAQINKLHWIYKASSSFQNYIYACSLSPGTPKICKFKTMIKTLKIPLRQRAVTEWILLTNPFLQPGASNLRVFHELESSGLLKFLWILGCHPFLITSFVTPLPVASIWSDQLCHSPIPLPLKRR